MINVKEIFFRKKAEEVSFEEINDFLKQYGEMFFEVYFLIRINGTHKLSYKNSQKKSKFNEIVKESLSYFKRTYNDFLENVDLVIYENTNGYISIGFDYTIKPPIKTIIKKDLISQVKFEDFSYLFNEGVRDFLLPTLDAMGRVLINANMEKSYSSYVFEFIWRVGDLEVEVSTIKSYSGTRIEYEVNDQAYHDYISKRSEINYRCIESDRAHGFKYND